MKMTDDLMLLRYLNVQSGNGFSVDKDLDGYSPTREAYAVGGATESVECVDNNLLSFNAFRYTMELKIEFMKRQPDTTTQVIGAWVNDDNYAYIEVADIVFDREEAIALGRERGEEAIYDFANSESVYL
jgi:ornithine cyclodeaminase/alanine dehydrogenase-like protein (mu-crystallin family)